MKLLIVNGIPDDPKYMDIEKRMELELKLDTTVELDYLKLRDMNIQYCTGCWDCWVKTPGLCAIKDDQSILLEKMILADDMLFITPVIVGYESALLKKTKDRIIPIAHPYIEMYNGEQHHRQRYPKSPDFSVLLIQDELTDEEDINIIKHTYERVSLNFHSTLKNFTTINLLGGQEHVISNFKW